MAAKAAALESGVKNKVMKQGTIGDLKLKLPPLSSSMTSFLREEARRRVGHLPG